MRIAVDAMGGDHAPEAVVKGALLALQEFPNLEVILTGDVDRIMSLTGDVNMKGRLTVVNATEVIRSDEDPVRAFRKKKGASMVLAAREVAEGRADACLSAGSTGAYLATGLFGVGRIEGIDRPALAPVLPTKDGTGFVLLDVGANAEVKPEYLVQFAFMGTVYAEKIRGVKNPRVALLNIGAEDNKGTDLTREAFRLLRERDDLNFIGNVEARYLMDGVADVVVTDGFTGNMVLKTIEGTAGSLMKMVKEAMTANVKSKIGALLLKSSMMDLKKKMDYEEQGGAALFGLKAPVIKAHGSSDQQAIYHAIHQSMKMVEADVASFISERLAKK